jgi:uncharacterized repeat protein (TIGR04138 family)
MELAPFAEAIARLCASDPRYSPDAYVFLNEGLARTLKAVQEKEKRYRQITGAKLANGLREFALEQYGPLAHTVLGRWGIHSTRDFGEMVFALLSIGLLGKTDEDKIEDFDDVYDFDHAFRSPFLPSRTHTHSPHPQSHPQSHS